jgi:hypothetical protein
VSRLKRIYVDANKKSIRAPSTLKNAAAAAAANAGVVAAAAAGARRWGLLQRGNARTISKKCLRTPKENSFELKWGCDVIEIAKVRCKQERAVNISTSRVINCESEHSTAPHKLFDM